MRKAYTFKDLVPKTFFLNIPVCENGYYNSTCTDKCGHCKNQTACDKTDGTCNLGCKSNFRPPFCQGMLLFEDYMVIITSIF